MEFDDDIDTCTNYIYSHKSFNESKVQIATKQFLQNNELRQAVWNYSTSNVALIHIYYNEINMECLVRQEAYTISSFVAAIGGLLSLAMGMSFITLIELMYLVVRVIIIFLAYLVAWIPIPFVTHKKVAKVKAH